MDLSTFESLDVYLFIYKFLSSLDIIAGGLVVLLPVVVR